MYAHQAGQNGKWAIGSGMRRSQLGAKFDPKLNKPWYGAEGSYEAPQEGGLDVGGIGTQLL